VQALLLLTTVKTDGILSSDEYLTRLVGIQKELKQ